VWIEERAIDLIIGASIVGRMDASLTGVLLAGGRSARMGMDKAAMAFDGEPLAVRVARRLGECCDRVLVASGDGRRLAWLGLEQVADPIPDAGPLAGIVAGLEHAPGPAAAVAAVDMPFASPGVLRLLASLRGDADAVVPVTDDGLEPLHAVYATSAAAALRSELESGVRAVREAIEGLRVRLVERLEWSPADPSGAFARNLNRPADLPRGSG
jgi:molybdopterin-guanine dinucleotide biosynthesis protein A